MWKAKASLPPSELVCGSNEERLLNPPTNPDLEPAGGNPAPVDPPATGPVVARDRWMKSIESALLPTFCKPSSFSRKWFDIHADESLTTLSIESGDIIDPAQQYPVELCERPRR